MKKQLRLLVLVLALLAFVAVVASCSPTDDTGAATTTTTAAQAAGIPQEELDKINFNGLVDVPYDGKPLTSSDVGVNKPNFLKAAYTFKQIDPATGAVIADLGVTYPTNVGTYEITATFSWNTGAEEMYPGAALPAPVSKTFKVIPGDAGRASEFGVKATTIFFYPGMQYNPAADNGSESFVTGSLPAGVSYGTPTIEKLASATATSGTPVAGGKITEAGIYKVTVNYTQEGENYTAASLAGKTAILTVEECPNQVLYVENNAIDGVIDGKYTGTATLTGKNQAYTLTNGVYTLTAVDGKVVDPMNNIPLLKINHGKNAGAEGSQLQVEVSVVWGTVAGKTGDYVSVAVKVVDATDNARSVDYTEALNPWVNDGIEVYYNFGGYSAPTFKKNGTNWPETYPTYSTVVNDSAARVGAAPTAVDYQKSAFFADIVYAYSRTVNGNTVTYISEYAFPANKESNNGLTGPEFARTKGAALTAGEFVYLAFQFNDLLALNTVQNPLDGSATVGSDGYSYDAKFPTGQKYPNYANDYKLTRVAGSEWDLFEKTLEDYMACYGNRSVWYLMHEQGGVSYFQLAAKPAQ